MQLHLYFYLFFLHSELYVEYSTTFYKEAKAERTKDIVYKEKARNKRIVSGMNKNITKRIELLYV